MPEKPASCSIVEPGKKRKATNDEPYAKRFADLIQSRGNINSFRNYSDEPDVERSSLGSVVSTGVPVSSLDVRYQGLFAFPYFNTIQSKAFHSTQNSDESLVISSSTGSGKTAVMELTIVKILQDLDSQKIAKTKIIYMAPVKALCSERHADWSQKFSPFGIKCLELTGDSDINPSEFMAHMSQCRAVLMLTTPEKWDSLTRKWRDYGTLVTSVSLFLIDEVHLLNENQRGPTLEAVVSRMRTVRLFAPQQETRPLRFVGCSATIPNAADLAEWLGTPNRPALLFQCGEEQRPVQLERIILGYNAASGASPFKFDLSLNYKLPDLISRFSHGKPTLIFCTTRKGVQQTATYLAKMLLTRIVQPEVEKRLAQAVHVLHEPKLIEMLSRGVAFHHAGLSVNDRRVVEQLFLAGCLPVLVSTSTLALGVNLPAHLVIVKSTTQMVAGSSGQEYSSAQLLQMIGRAGRPQFDTHATAIVMTKANLKEHYEAVLVSGQTVESCLHLSLKEHLNAEVSLGTITDVSMAVAWLKTTFLFVRALRQPDRYGIRLPPSRGHDDVLLCRSKVEQYLYDLCVRELNALNRLGLTTVQDMYVMATSTGRLMARCYIAYDTMALFSKVTGEQGVADLLETLCGASELADVQLRVNERKTLNELNRDKKRVTVRYPLLGRITTRHAKVNCLIQASLGCLAIADPTLAQEAAKILRLAHRLAKCLVEYLWCQLDRNRDGRKSCARSLLNALVLAKCLKCGLWENSPYVSKQIERIGLVMSRNLVEAGYASFERLGSAHPRDLEKILNRAPPFGSRLIALFQQLPRYSIAIEQSNRFQAKSAQLDIAIRLDNRETLSERGTTTGDGHTVAFLVCDADNNVLLKNRIRDKELLSGDLQLKLKVDRATKGDDLEFHIISESWIGLDVSSTFTPFYAGGARSKVATRPPIEKASAIIPVSRTLVDVTSDSVGKKPRWTDPTGFENLYDELDLDDFDDLDDQPVVTATQRPINSTSTDVSISVPQRNTNDLKLQNPLIDHHDVSSSVPPPEINDLEVLDNLDDLNDVDWNAFNRSWSSDGDELVDQWLEPNKNEPPQTESKSTQSKEFAFDFEF